MTKLTKPRLAIAVALVAASVIGVAAVVLSGGGGSDAPPAPDEAAANYNAYVSVSDVRFEMTTLAPGEVPSEDHGILFVDAVSGAGELWTVSEVTAITGPLPWLYYDVDRSHRWLQLLAAYGPEPLLLIGDRETGITYRLREGWTIAYGPSADGRLVIQAGPDFALLRLGEPDKTVKFYVPDVQAQSSVAPLGDGTHVVVSGAIVDVTTGEVSRFGAGAGERQRHWTFTVGNGIGIAVESAPDAAELTVRRFDATGRMVNEWRFPLGRPHGFAVLPSPDGRWLAWQDSLPLNTIPFEDFWPAVTLINLDSGQVVLRAVRASTRVGPYQLQWLSDSSGIVVDSSLGFTVLTPDASLYALAVAPRLYAAIPAWGHAVAVEGLPGLTDLVSRWHNAIPETEYGTFEYGFNLSSDEVSFVKDSPHYADYLTFPLRQVGLSGLSLKIDEPPLADGVRLRVLSNGEGLNVREGPGVSQRLLGTLRDAALVTVTPGFDRVNNQCISDAGCSAVRDVDAEPGPDTSWWIHVRAEDGLEGWVAAEYLVWAD